MFFEVAESEYDAHLCMYYWNPKYLTNGDLPIWMAKIWQPRDLEMEDKKV